MESKKTPTTDDLNALFIDACEKQQNGHLKEAEIAYLELLELFPEAPILYYNLGLVYFAKEQYAKAVTAFEHGLQHTPEDLDLLFNLALSKKQCGDIRGAASLFRALIEKTPESIDALYNLGGCYRELRDNKAAIAAYEKVLQLNPEHSSANNNIAYVYQIAGETEKAITHFKKVVELRPDHESASYMLSALQGEVVESPPDSYVLEVFDNYSERYEESLVEELQYDVPAKLKRIVDTGKKWKTDFVRALDLGCGTGLSGVAFCEVVGKMVGVDLSPKMVELAELKGIYDHLEAGNISDFLKQTENKYDFFLAADVFGYVGELEEIFHLLVQNATEDALLVFSTESHDGDRFILRENGRFAHAREYVEKCCSENGWEIFHREDDVLRKEKGQWVAGELWVLGRTAGELQP